MSRRDFLVEIGTEELPPLSLVELADAFAAGIDRGLSEARLPHGRIQRFASPRRLAVLAKGLAEQQPEQEIKRRGPPVSAAFDPAGLPTRAALAFADSCGVPVDALQRVQESKGEFLFFEGRKPGALTRDLLVGIVQRALDALPVARRMRWGDGDIEFVRPVHWVVLLFGKEVVPGRILGIESGQMTQGHRFHAPKPLRISTPGAYAGSLRKRGYVIADFAERREIVRRGALEAAAAMGGQALISDELLDEVTALVEWPVALTGGFEPRFLELPREVLIATLQDHQRYFPIEASGRLLAQFVAVSNIESRDPAQVRAGNERVVRPRLSDAAFFYDQDRKRRLATRLSELSHVTFQSKLGSLGDKAARLRELATEVGLRVGADPAIARRAAELCKCDLLTAMVGEFPELQGTMGRYYALHDGEPPEVADAIAEHYWPRFAGDSLPRSRSGMTVALADKLDTITGIFAIDQRPTGTRDPFGLRRAALGVLRILLENQVDLDLREILGKAAALVRADIARVASASAPAAASAASDQGIADAVYDYIVERLRAYYLEGSAGIAVSTEMFDAVLTNRPASILDFDARLRALGEFLKLDDATSLSAANKRIANILRKSGEQEIGAVRAELLQSAAEQRLFAELQALRPQVEPLFARREYAAGLHQLARLRPAVDSFFDSVMVMDENAELRLNRLALLSELRHLFLHTADLSRLPG